MTATPQRSSDPEEPADPRREIGRLLKQVLSSLMRHIDQRMQPMGLTAMQWQPLVLIHLRNIDTVAALAREIHVDCGAMTRMLDRLESKGLVRRRRSDADRRVVHLELTSKGRTIAAEIMPRAVEALDEHLLGFTPQEVSLLNDMLTRMLANGTRQKSPDPDTQD